MATKKKTGVEKIMEKSGNSFHARVVKLLRDQKWTVLVSPYYSDNFTDKPREIDIIAERKFDINDFISDWLGTLNVRLFIECKYINGKTVFWFDEKDKAKATERIKDDTGMEYSNYDIQKLHYFSNTPVAKLFSSEKSRNEDSEPISKAINQNLNALVYYRHRHDLVPVNPNRRNRVLQRVPYPIIVVNSFDNFFRVSMADDGTIEPITESFQLEVNYAYKDNNVFIDKHRGDSRNEYFLIDVVSFDKLQEFLSTLENADIKTIIEKICWEERMKKNQQQQNRGYGNNSAR